MLHIIFNTVYPTLFSIFCRDHILYKKFQKVAKLLTTYIFIYICPFIYLYRLQASHNKIVDFIRPTFTFHWGGCFHLETKCNNSKKKKFKNKCTLQKTGILIAICRTFVCIFIWVATIFNWNFYFKYKKIYLCCAQFCNFTLNICCTLCVCFNPLC